MGKRTLFWILFVLLSASSVVFTLAYFSDAFPLVTLNLQMDRSDAFQSSRELADRYGWGPEGFRQAASFGVDSTVQTYVELEAGGAGAFREMIEGGLFSPYTWEVRHFRENEINETSVFFTPEGKPYGFVERLPEGQPGASLERASARELAEQSGEGDWGIDFAEFQLIEESEEVRTGGRTDHSLVYERRADGPGESSYRLRLVVGGDRLTELSHFVKVPEEFIRAYEEMRSANDTIALAASIAFFFLYVLGGCVIGLFFLLRRKWVIWKAPLIWGCVIGLLQFFSGINHFPIMWMNYDTALSAESFVLQQAGGVLASSVLMTLLMVLSFMAAESLTRKAFPEHIQLWRIWSRDVASTSNVAGYTLAGYLLVAVFFAYEVILYLLNSRLFGWWSPSDALFDPDLMASYFPWLTSIANSAQAGFWEECLFRAVPLAGAALLGNRFGRKAWWIGSALVLQALIFGAAHANYPAQPAYARVVELMIPAIGFGLIYLAYGLLPAIILHYAYDVVWMALPLFVSTASGIWIDRTLVILFALVPLGAVILARTRSGEWQHLTSFALNASWRPERKNYEEVKGQGRLRQEFSGLENDIELVPDRGSRRWLWPAIGAAGLAAWIAFIDFSADAPPVDLDRSTVEAEALAEMESRELEMDDSWKIISTIVEPSGIDDSFLWREGGSQEYRKLIGEYLSPPLWMIRIASFEGDIAARAEEYRLYFDGGGKMTRFVHILPEKAEGEFLEEDEAREIAERAIVSRYRLDPARLGRVSSEPVKKDNRRDWVFVYSDSDNYTLEQGDARVEVTVSGDEVTDSRRFIFVPEEWTRREKSRRMTGEILRYGSYGVIALVLLAGLAWGIVSWSRGRFSVKAFLYGTGSLFMLNLLAAANNWHQALAGFSTAQPFRNQVLILVLGGLLAAVFLSGAVGVLLGMSHYLAAGSKRCGSPYLRGASLGLAASGLLALADFFSPDLEPLWPNLSALNAVLPFLYYFISPLLSFLVAGTFFLFAFSAVSYFTGGWSGRRALFSVLLFLFGAIIAGSQGVSGMTSWLLASIGVGLAVSAAYIFIIRHNPATVLPAIAVMIVLGQAREACMLPGIMPLAGFFVSLALLALATWIWCSRGFFLR